MPVADRVNLGDASSTEEHDPRDIVGHARMAEERGFEYALVSDHFHPWVDRQGQSPFVWSPLGALGQVLPHAADISIRAPAAAPS